MRSVSMKSRIVQLAIFAFAVGALMVTQSGCGPKVNNVSLQFESDFSGLVVIRAKPEANNPFKGRVIVPKSGEIEVADKGFYDAFSVTAARADGGHLPIALLRDSASASTFGLWELPEGAYIRYFFLGRRDEVEKFYRLNKERLYQVEETRLKRTVNSVELKIERH